MFFVALLCRESAVLSPFYLALILLVYGYNLKNRKTAGILTASTVISMAYLFLRTKFLPNSALSLFFEISNYVTLKNIIAFFVMIGSYFTSAFVPWHIYFFRAINSYGPMAFGFLCRIALSFTILLFFLSKKNRLVLFGSCWFALGVLLLYKMMFYHQTIGVLMQTSWIYFSSIGLFFILSMGLLEIKKNLRARFFYFYDSSYFIFFTENDNKHSYLVNSAKILFVLA